MSKLNGYAPRVRRATKMIARVFAFALVVAVVAGLAPLEARAQTGLSPALRELYEKARAEGEVVYWASGPDVVNWIQDEFGKRFPGIAIKWTADLDTPTKLIAEYRAGRHSVDLFTFSIGGMLPLHERNMFAAVDWKALGVGKEDIFLGGRAAAVLNLVNTLIYDSKVLRREDVPKSWDELLDPKWRGRIGASEVLLPRTLAFLALVWGEDKAAQFARDLRDKAQVLMTRAPTEGLLRSGERPIIIGEFISTAMIWKSRGAAADWVAMNPTGAVQFAVAVMDKAPHPNAARLLAGWLVSDEARELRERIKFHVDVRPAARTEMGKAQAAAHPQLVFEDVDTLKRRVELYNKLAPILQGIAR